MAKLTIEIEENEYALYDVRCFLDGQLFDSIGNFTSEDAALFFARESALEHVKR